MLLCNQVERVHHLLLQDLLLVDALQGVECLVRLGVLALKFAKLGELASRLAGAILGSLLLSVFLGLLFRFWARYNCTGSRYNFVWHRRMWVHVADHRRRTLNRPKAHKVAALVLKLYGIDIVRLQGLIRSINNHVVGSIQ